MNFIGWSLGLHPQLESRSRRISRSNNQSPNQKDKSLNYEKQSVGDASINQSTKQSQKNSSNQTVNKTRRHTIDLSSINQSNNQVHHSIYRNHVLNESSHLTQRQPPRKSSDQSIKQTSNQVTKQLSNSSVNQSFSRRLRDPLLEPLINQFRSFVHLIETIDNELIDRLIVRSQIHSLIDRSVHWLKEHPWLINQSTVQSNNQPLNQSLLNNAKQAIEKYLLSKLHYKLYSINESINQSQRVFDCKSDFLVDWLNWRHFELPSDIFDQSSIFDAPSVELRRLVDYKSPKDKLIVLLNTCVLLNQSINHAIDQSHKQSTTQSKIGMDEQSIDQENMQQSNQTDDQSINQNFISADIFLPAFILLVIHASRPFSQSINQTDNESIKQSNSQRIELVKDLAWINMGSRELFGYAINQSINQSVNQSLRGECEYCLTMVQSAVCFIQSIDQSNIKLQPVDTSKQSNNHSSNQMNEWDYRIQQWKIQHLIDESNTQSLDQMIRQLCSNSPQQPNNQSNNQNNQSNTASVDDGCDSLPTTPQKVHLSD